MTRLSRSRAIRAAIATAAVIAAAGCAQQASLDASPAASMTMGTFQPHLARIADPHATSSAEPRHSASPTRTRKATAGKPATGSTAGSSGSGPATSAPPPPAESGVCATSATKGECGPYSDAQIEGLGSGNQDKIQVGNNMWATVSGASSTLYASSPADWHVIADMPAGNTSIVSYPSLSVDFHLENSSGNWYEQPLTNFKTMTSSFSEDMDATGGTSAWAAYDIWLNDGANEVMIQHDFADNGACTAVATATFGGSNGVPAQEWHLCKFGSEQVWKLGASDSSKVSEQSGSVDILSMLTWMENHGDLPQGSTIGLLGYGWEIASTGGKSEDFQVKSFSIATS